MVSCVQTYPALAGCIAVDALHDEEGLISIPYRLFRVYPTCIPNMYLVHIVPGTPVLSIMAYHRYIQLRIDEKKTINTSAVSSIN